jgi:cellulose synthase/poly-beta-1,6-N-acetylglucosamine synthase-like glycosyltransferase
MGQRQRLLIVSGAFGLFQRGLVEEVGGYRLGTVGEDIELIVRITATCGISAKYRISFIPEPTCWTERPRRSRRCRDSGGGAGRAGSARRCGATRA